VVPRSRGGPDIEANLVDACSTCNQRKSDRLPSEWAGAKGNAAAIEIERHVRALGPAAIVWGRKDILRLAAEAELDPRTVRRAAEHGLRSIHADWSRIRLVAAAKLLGLPLPPEAA
jgi:hypothetical protein